MTVKVTEHDDGRRVLEVDIGNLPPEAAGRYLNKLKEELGAKRVPIKKKTFWDKIADSWLGSYF